MNRFFKSIGFKIFLGLTAALLAGAVTAAVLNSNSAPQTSAAGLIFGPLQRFSSYLAGELSDFSVPFKSSAALSEENAELKKEVARLTDELVDYERAKHDLARYEKFLGVKEENPSFKFAAAAVIARDPGDKFFSFTAGKGSLHGVSVNDPVISGKYLVGVVTSVMPTQCKVSTLLNPAVNVGAFEISTRESGFVTTTPELSEKGLCRLPGLERTTAVVPGSVVVTSGIGGVYPRNLIIGTVDEVANDTADISSFAVIKPGADPTQLQDVFIIIDFEGQAGSGEGQGQ